MVPKRDLGFCKGSPVLKAGDGEGKGEEEKESLGALRREDLTP